MSRNGEPSHSASVSWASTSGTGTSVWAADRLHHPPLQLEVVLGEHRELLRRQGREAGDEALGGPSAA